MTDSTHQFRNGPLAPPSANPTASEQARHYIETLGLSVIPCEAGGKQPLNKGWPTQHVSADECERLFQPNIANPAVRLGNSSRGLIDVDLDWPECVPVADFVMAKLVSFGRPSKQRSHRIALCAEAMQQDECKQVVFKLPPAVKNDHRFSGEHGLCVAELRGNGQYTIFPGSTHPSREPYTWGNDGPLNLGSVAWSEAEEDTGLISLVAVIIRCYPPVGLRNDYSLAANGTLCRVLMRQPEYADGTRDRELAQLVDVLMKIVYDAAGDKGTGSSWLERGGPTLNKIRKGERCTGLPRLVQIAGLPKECVALFSGWVGGSEADFDQRPHVRWDESNITETLDAIMAALVDGDVPIYQQGGRLVQVYRQDQMNESSGVKHPPGALVIQPLPELRLYQLMLGTCHFTKTVISKKTKKPVEIPAPPPDKAAAHLLAYREGWRFPVLRGVCETPTLRADGSLLTDDGYDARSGLVLNTNGVVYPPIPDKPTREDAEAALKLFLEPYAEFPFVMDDDGKGSSALSVAVSAALSGLVRRTLRACPLHAFTAPTMATGKSLQCDVVSLIATGKLAATMSQGANEEEDEKRHIGNLLRGAPLVVIDNIDHPLGGTFLCSMLSQETVQVRVLGSTGQFDVPTNMLFLANGNNLVLEKDITTRALLCRMDAGVESPEERSFRCDLKKWVPENRPALVSAGLTILSAYHCAGRPKDKDKPLKPFGRFEDWSDLVRGALVWLGMPDPVMTRASVASSDPDREVHSGLMLALAESPLDFRSTPFTTRDLINYMAGNTDLRQALEAACPRGIVTETALGKLLRKWAGKPVQGLKLVEKHTHGYRKFQVVEVKDVGPGTQGQLPGVEEAA